MGSEMVMVGDIPFPLEITTTKPLPLIGRGITDIEIHFLQIKHNAIGIYCDESIADHLGNWKGKKERELISDDCFFDALVSAPVEKYFRVVVIKEIKGAQFGVQIETALRDRLVSADKYEDDEEAELEKIVEFFQTPYFKKGSVVTFYFPENTPTAEMSYVIEEKDEAKIKVGNANVAEMIRRWYLGGSIAVSPSTVQSLAEKFETILSSA
ncbi:probable chalcone--flavonone isomerase 3 [Asparagus officinalis]|uniref:probable chalcone--flavonone isomerase 3 n=1 Tax=Asparagus officinalis TaxID=4686 RepID=UPI00098E6C6C|nr:probable chalcone--flavonone isomerase 3 [Asparagus officinalis]